MKISNALMKKIRSNLPAGAEFIIAEKTMDGVDEHKQYDNKIRVAFRLNGHVKSFVMSAHPGTKK